MLAPIWPPPLRQSQAWPSEGGCATFAFPLAVLAPVKELLRVSPCCVFDVSALQQSRRRVAILFRFFVHITMQGDETHRWICLARHKVLEWIIVENIQRWFLSLDSSDMPVWISSARSPKKDAVGQSFSERYSCTGLQGRYLPHSIWLGTDQMMPSGRLTFPATGFTVISVNRWLVHQINLWQQPDFTLTLKFTCLHLYKTPSESFLILWMRKCYSEEDLSVPVLSSCSFRGFKGN